MCAVYVTWLNLVSRAVCAGSFGAAFAILLGTNLIHRKNARFHGRVFKICQISQLFFQGAWLMQTKKSVELHIDISEQQIFIIVINVLSQESLFY